MHRCGGCALLKANLENALDIGLFDESHDAQFVPCGGNSVRNIGCNRNSTADNLGQQSAALIVLARLDVVRICDIVFVRCTDFFVRHCFLLLKDFDFFTLAVCDLFTQFGFFKFNSLAPFKFIIDGTGFGF